MLTTVPSGRSRSASRSTSATRAAGGWRVRVLVVLALSGSSPSSTDLCLVLMRACPRGVAYLRAGLLAVAELVARSARVGWAIADGGRTTTADSQELPDASSTRRRRRVEHPRIRSRAAPSSGRSRRSIETERRRPPRSRGDKSAARADRQPPTASVGGDLGEPRRARLAGTSTSGIGRRHRPSGRRCPARTPSSSTWRLQVPRVAAACAQLRRYAVRLVGPAREELRPRRSAISWLKRILAGDEERLHASRLRDSRLKSDACGRRPGVRRVRAPRSLARPSSWRAAAFAAYGLCGLRRA